MNTLLLSCLVFAGPERDFRLMTYISQYKILKAPESERVEIFVKFNISGLLSQ